MASPTITPFLSLIPPPPPPPPQRETYTNVSLVLKQLKEEVEKVLQIESRDTEMFNKAKTVQVDAYFVCFMNSFYHVSTFHFEASWLRGKSPRLWSERSRVRFSAETKSLILWFVLCNFMSYL